MTQQYSSLFESLEPVINSSQLDLFANTGISQTEPNLFSNSVPDLFANTESDLFANTESDETNFEVQCTCYLSCHLCDTEREDDILPAEQVVSNLYLVSDQLAGLGHYTLSDIVESVAELV